MLPHICSPMPYLLHEAMEAAATVRSGLCHYGTLDASAHANKGERTVTEKWNRRSYSEHTEYTEKWQRGEKRTQHTCSRAIKANQCAARLTCDWLGCDFVECPQTCEREIIAPNTLSRIAAAWMTSNLTICGPMAKICLGWNLIKAKSFSQNECSQNGTSRCHRQIDSWIINATFRPSIQITKVALFGLSSGQ